MLFSCGATSYHVAKRTLRYDPGKNSKRFHNAPRQEYVVLDDSCVCRKATFRQFKGQYRSLHPGPPLKKPFAQGLEVYPVFLPQGCIGLYYYYNVNINLAMWRGTPVFSHPLLIMDDKGIHLLTEDSTHNRQVLASYRGTSLYDSLARYSGIIVRGQINVAH